MKKLWLFILDLWHVFISYYIINPWNLHNKNPWSLFISQYSKYLFPKLMVSIHFTSLLWLSIERPMRKSHYSIIVVVTIFYLKPIDIASTKTHGKDYSQETLEVYYLKGPKKISFTNNQRQKLWEAIHIVILNPWKLIPKIYHKYLLKLMNIFHFCQQLKPMWNKNPWQYIKTLSIL